MKVLCIANKGRDLYERTLLKQHTANSQFPLDIGEYYLVYGITLWEGNLHYLVVNRYKGIEQAPLLCPVELFEVTDSRLPQGWHHKFLGDKNINDASWGYKEFVLDPIHFEALFEREAQALQLFFQRKREMDDSLTT